MDERVPIGIIPKHLWDERRLNNLIDAFGRYTEYKHPIPVEWIKEYNQLTETKQPDELIRPESNLWKGV